MTTTIPDEAIKETVNGILLRIHLQPRASRTEICGVHGEELKVRVTSPPVDDAANKLCIEFFASVFSVAKSKVSIVSGTRSRHKTLRITDTTRESATAILGKEIKNT
ncbi:MAG TPA: DUF167 family protein [Geobacteraceae bacterium]|nr:DUF167 family protein [Geobacteraceae bacterium]